MDTYLGETLAVAETGSTGPREWVQHVIALLDAAVGQLDHEQVVHGTILKAASLLRKQIDPEVAQGAPGRSGGLRAWQARKVRAYIESHVAGPVLVADLGALVRLSEAHFSRAFRRTFGRSPHAFLIRRRVELAAQYMLQTEAPLSDIALRCGFTDQPHLCRHFRQIMGHTPAAWRRAHNSEYDDDPHRTAALACGRATSESHRTPNAHAVKFGDLRGGDLFRLPESRSEPRTGYTSHRSENVNAVPNQEP